MSGPVYATEEDVYLLATPRGSLRSRARDVASVDPTANTLELDNHGFSSRTRVQVRAQGSGILPAGLSASVVYWALPVDGSSSLVQLSLTEGGAAVDLTSAGTAPFCLYTPVSANLAANLIAASRDADAMCIAHKVPFEAPYPPVVVNYVAVFSGWATARALDQGEVADGLQQLKDEWTTKALRWGQGAPLRDGDATPRRNLAIGRTPSASRRGNEVIG